MPRHEFRTKNETRTDACGWVCEKQLFPPAHHDSPSAHTTKKSATNGADWTGRSDHLAEHASQIQNGGLDTTIPWNDVEWSREARSGQLRYYGSALCVCVSRCVCVCLCCANPQSRCESRRHNDMVMTTHASVDVACSLAFWLLHSNPDSAQQDTRNMWNVMN